MRSHDDSRGVRGGVTMNAAIICGSATPCAAGGVGGGEVVNELCDLNIHPNEQSQYCNCCPWTSSNAMDPVSASRTRPHYRHCNTASPQRHGALDLVLDAFGQRVSLIFSADTFGSIQLFFITSLHSNTINVTSFLNRIMHNYTYYLYSHLYTKILGLFDFWGGCKKK